MASIGDVDRNVTITFIGRDNASRAMTGIGNSASRTSKIVGGLVKVLKYAALAAVAALAAGAVLLAKGLWSATRAAYDDDIAMKKLAETQMRAQDATRAQAEATSDYIDKMELATGIADDELRPAMENLALTGMSVKKSQEQLSLAADIAVAKNVSLTSASSALAKAYNGQLTGLSRLGIKTTDANGEALTLAETQKLLRERFLGAAKAAGKTDPLKRLEAAYNQVKEEVGAELLPMLRKFSNWIIEVGVPWIKGHLVPWVKKLAGWLGENLPKAAAAISDWWKKSGKEAFSELWNKIKDVWNSTLDLVSAFSGKEGANTKLGQGGKAAENMATAVGSLADMLKPVIDSLTWLETHGQWLSRLNEAARLLNPILQLVSAIEKFKELSETGKITLPDYLVPDALTDAHGGWLKRAQGGWAGRMTLVGEHGPELISNRGYVKSHSQSMGMMGGGGPTFIIQGAIDPVGTARQIRNILAKGDRASGRATLGLA